MHATTLRFPDDIWQHLEREARLGGVSTAQFIRDASLLRIAGLAGHRRDEPLLLEIADLADQAPRRRQLDPIHSPARVAALASLVFEAETGADALDTVAAILRRTLGADLAMVTIAGTERLFTLGTAGAIDPEHPLARVLPLAHTLCREVVAGDAPLIAEDLAGHPVFSAHPVHAGLGVGAYAGVPLHHAGQPVGTLCAFNAAPRPWTTDDAQALHALVPAALAALPHR